MDMDIEMSNVYDILANIAIKSISKNRPVRRLDSFATITYKHSNDIVEIDDGIYDKIYIGATETNTIDVVQISMLTRVKCNLYIIHLFNDKYYDYIYEYLRLVSYSAYDISKLADILIPIYAYKKLTNITEHIKECIDGIDDIDCDGHIDRLFYTYSDDESDNSDNSDESSESVVSNESSESVVSD